MSAHQYTEFGIRWTMEHGVPRVVLGGTRAAAEELLDDPPAGSLDGVVVERVVTLSPWEPATGVQPRTPPLFAQPRRVFTLPGFPDGVVRDSSDFDGLGYIVLGDDAEQIVILGHPLHADVTAFQRWYEKNEGGDPDNSGYSDTVETTYARQLRECPTHQRKTRDCTWCTRIDPDEPWLDWTRADNEPPHANATTPHYFPITLWHLHG
ncbi:MAG: hypothetical protein QOF58_7987 [Pseudonocardiales bacterium]|jgi:hypothetical protein|nr:hypothetical protein [Pseudonocardiales bacterium]